MGKIRDLNKEIAANAEKVATALTMSKEDESIIGNLKQESEKAWKMVDYLQVRTVITRLRCDGSCLMVLLLLACRLNHAVEILKKEKKKTHYIKTTCNQTHFTAPADICPMDRNHKKKPISQLQRTSVQWIEITKTNPFHSSSGHLSNG
jgi:hypothetical protein